VQSQIVNKYWTKCVCTKFSLHAEVVGDRIQNFSSPPPPIKVNTTKTTTRIDNHLGLVSDEVHFRFRWLRGCGRWDMDLGRLIRFLDQNVDERLLFGWRRDRREVRHGGWWRCGCLDEHDLVVLLRWWRRLHRLLRCVVRRLWRRNVHVHVLVYDGCLLRWPILWRWPAARVRPTATATTDGCRVAVQREPRESATASAETCQWRFGSAQASAHC